MMSFSTTTTFAVVLLITTLLFVIAATSTAVLVSAAAAAEKTTTTTTITVDNWYIPYDGPKTLTANVGDTITFGWNTGHNVYIHPTMDCELDGVIFVGDTSPTSYTFTDADADADADGTDMFFACDIGSGLHCKNGQNLIVTVFPASDDGSTTNSNATNNTTSSPTVTPQPGCTSICNPVGEIGSNLKNPDTVIEYNWNPRVPLCSTNIGSCQIESCATLERNLPSFSVDECNKHQIGLQSSGCECDNNNNKGSSSSSSSNHGIIIYPSTRISFTFSLMVVLATVLLVVAGAN